MVSGTNGWKCDEKWFVQNWHCALKLVLSYSTCVCIMEKRAGQKFDTQDVWNCLSCPSLMLLIPFYFQNFEQIFGSSSNLDCWLRKLFKSDQQKQHWIWVITILRSIIESSAMPSRPAIYLIILQWSQLSPSCEVGDAKYQTFTWSQYWNQLEGA